VALARASPWSDERRIGRKLGRIRANKVVTPALQRLDTLQSRLLAGTWEQQAQCSLSHRQHRPAIREENAVAWTASQKSCLGIRLSSVDFEAERQAAIFIRQASVWRGRETINIQQQGNLDQVSHLAHSQSMVFGSRVQTRC